MGRVIRAQRKGSSTVYVSRNIHKIGKPQHRDLDYAERKAYVRGLVREIVHEPGRGAPLAKVVFKSETKFGKNQEIFLACESMYTGQFVYAGQKAQMTIGNICQIGNLPEGASVCNVEQKPGDRGIFAKSSGESAVIIAHNPEEGVTRIRLPSGAKKSVSSTCRAMVGVISGGGRTEKPILKAGTCYWMAKAKGRKMFPRVRGVAMNPVDHPHGGGNHQHIGHPATCSRHAPAGQKTGLIAARRTGRIAGGQNSMAGRISKSEHE